MAADNADVLAADNADVLAADTTDVLAADNKEAPVPIGLPIAFPIGWEGWDGDEEFPYQGPPDMGWTPPWQSCPNSGGPPKQNRRGGVPPMAGCPNHGGTSPMAGQGITTPYSIPKWGQ